MNIMIGINSKYTFPAKVMLTSLCENNLYEKHTVYVLHDKNHLRKEDILSLKGLERKYELTVYPVEIDAGIFDAFPTSFHFSIETYFRFLAQEFLPQTIDRILWLDVDMIVVKGLGEFYYQDFENKSIVVCKTANPDAPAFLERLGIDPTVGYFNAGIILFNMERINKCITLDTYRNCLNTLQDRIVWLDQDILNVVFASDKKLIDSQVYNYTFLSDTNISKEIIQHIDENVYILHYIGGVKPWHPEYMNKAIRYFRKYARKNERFVELLKFELVHLYERIQKCS